MGGQNCFPADTKQLSPDEWETAKNDDWAYDLVTARNWGCPLAMSRVLRMDSHLAFAIVYASRKNSPLCGVIRNAPGSSVVLEY
jgi:hypothetical protein